MRIGRKEIGLDQPTYFIADIASNHDGSYTRAERLVYLAAEAGADAVKFQNFKAETIISDRAFRVLGQTGHQATWKESVYNTYKRYETPLDWTPDLKKVAEAAGVEYLTTPYDVSMLNYLADYVSAWKIGSGDITYEMLLRVAAGYGKPIILSTGASDMADIHRACDWLYPAELALLQCNTNYEGKDENRQYVNLLAILELPTDVKGLSDHTEGHAAVLGAVTLGARIIEKHFTDDVLRDGPDHHFSMTPVSWRTMVDRTRELESSFGTGVKKVEENEEETVILQRRSLCARRNIRAGEKLTESMLIPLRPCPKDGIPPFEVSKVVGRASNRDLLEGDYIRMEDLRESPLLVN